ncbi:MAG: hypothetical protein ACKVOE_07490 [Rickettsiales bacterium]
MIEATEPTEPTKKPWAVKLGEEDKRNVPPGAVLAAREELAALKWEGVDAHLITNHVLRLLDTQEPQNMGEVTAMLRGFVAQQEAIVTNETHGSKQALQAQALIDAARLCQTTLANETDKAAPRSVAG